MDSDESQDSQLEQREDLMKKYCFECENDKVDCNDPECGKCDYCQDSSDTPIVTPKDQPKKASVFDICIDCMARNVDCKDPECGKCEYCKELLCTRSLWKINHVRRLKKHIVECVD